MIAYEELVASLIEWRVRQGLSTGPTDYLGEPMPMPLVGPPHPEGEPAREEEYAELAEDEILSEEPAAMSFEGELGGGEEYPGAEPVAFPDTDAVSADALPDAGGALYGEATPGDAYGEAQPQAESWDPDPVEAPPFADQPAADAWSEPQPAADGWGEAQPQADEWGQAPAEAPAEAPAWDAAEASQPPDDAYAAENEVTEFAPPPGEAVADDREYAEVMEEAAPADLSGQTWDTEAEAEAVPAEPEASDPLYEQADALDDDAGQFDPMAAEPFEPEEAPVPAEEGDSTMDVDPADLLDAEELAPPLADVGEIPGVEGDPFGGPPPLEPPPEGLETTADDPLVDEVMIDPAAKPDPEQQ